MKRRLLIYSIIALTFVLFASSIALADCPSGKIAVTIVNPAGKVIEICVPEHVVDNIGGPGDVIISAICPCFNDDDIMAAPITDCSLFEGYTETGKSCTFILCSDNDDEYGFGAQGKPIGETCNYDIKPPFKCPENCCVAFTPTSEVSYDHITEEEGDACVSILRTFVQ